MAFSGSSLPAAHLVVGGDDGHGAHVDNAFMQALAREAAKHHAVVAPMRAQACMATTPSMVMGM